MVQLREEELIQVRGKEMVNVRGEGTCFREKRG